MNRRLYTWVCFNTQGNLRSFSSGFNKTEYKRLLLRDMELGYCIIQISSLDILPSKWLEDYYTKFSKNNDLSELLTILNKKQ